MTDQNLATQRNDLSFSSIWDELVWRGYVHVSTDADELKKHLDAGPVTFYIGFDPTATSLHVGSLVQILLMRRLQLAGHRPLALVGGSTGLIGDPKPTSERVLQSGEIVAAQVASIRAQIERFLDFDGDARARMVNNLDWTAPISAIDFLRDIGKHFRVNQMLKKDAVSKRLESEDGISYTEFSYQILQGLDYRELFRQYDCTLQGGGSDQWGNIVSGVDLIRRSEGKSVHALGTPLITTADGKKFGKSEGNAVWLDAELTSPYALYQFWVNTADADVINYLKVFTFRTRDEIAELERLTAEQPFKREAQRTLAHDVVTIVHGAEAADAAVAASLALFGNGDLTALDGKTLEAAIAELPRVSATAGVSIAQLLVDSGLVSSLSEARRALSQGGVYLNNEKVADQDAVLANLLHGRFAVLRRGKKSLAGVIAETIS